MASEGGEWRRAFPMLLPVQEDIKRGNDVEHVNPNGVYKRRDSPVIFAFLCMFSTAHHPLSWSYHEEHICSKYFFLLIFLQYFFDKYDLVIQIVLVCCLFVAFTSNTYVMANPLEEIPVQRPSASPFSSEGDGPLSLIPAEKPNRMKHWGYAANPAVALPGKWFDHSLLLLDITGTNTVI